MLPKKVIPAVCFGIFIGMVISPIMWISYFQDPLLQSLSPLCSGRREKGTSHPNSANLRDNLELELLERYRQSFDGQFEDASIIDQSNSKRKRKHFDLEYLNRSISPPGNLKTRYRHLSNELAPRKLLFIGVVTAKKYLETRAVAINNTWGRGIDGLYYFSSHSENKKVNLPIITLPGVNDSVYPPQRKVYHMLKYMHDHFIDEYDFFMRSDDDVYVKMDPLLELLSSVNPAQDIYMGCPGFGRPDDRTRIKLTEDEHYCMGGPGVIFSRSALRKLAPHLHTCLETVVVSYNEDVEVGRCVSKMLKLQCTWSWETRIIFWTDYKRILKTSELYTSQSVKRAITLHPIKDPRLMYCVHQYLQELKLKKLVQEEALIQKDIERISHLVPENMKRYKQKRWLWHDIATNPSSRFELPIWQYFNSSTLFSSHEYFPAIALPSRVRKGINSALEVLIDIMNEGESRKKRFIPPYHLFDGFLVIDHSSGVQYTFHLSVHKTGVDSAIEYVANVFLPFQGAGMASYQLARLLEMKIIHVIVSVGATTDLGEFLKMYEEVCIMNRLKTHLHIVLFGSNEKARSQVATVVSHHPQELISSYELMEGNASSPVGYDHVIGKLAPNDLFVLMDPTFLFTKEFIWHVKMNVVKGHQAYFPTLFSFYKPELISEHLPKFPSMMIAADTGFFVRYNYQPVAIYKSDYDIIKKVELTSAINRNYDIRFIDKTLHTNIYAMRALEPYLRRNYRTRTCSGLSGNSHTVCMHAKADAIGSKKILGSLLITNDLLDTL